MLFIIARELLPYASNDIRRESFIKEAAIEATRGNIQPMSVTGEEQLDESFLSSLFGKVDDKEVKRVSKEIEENDKIRERIIKAWRKNKNPDVLNQDIKAISQMFSKTFNTDPKTMIIAIKEALPFIITRKNILRGVENIPVNTETDGKKNVLRQQASRNLAMGEENIDEGIGDVARGAGELLRKAGEGVVKAGKGLYKGISTSELERVTNNIGKNLKHIVNLYQEKMGDDFEMKDSTYKKVANQFVDLIINKLQKKKSAVDVEAEPVKNQELPKLDKNKSQSLKTTAAGDDIDTENKESL
jgi:hypothetical protein